MNQWKSVKHDLPQNEQEVLCVDAFGNYECVRYCKGWHTGLMFFAASTGEFVATHWQPLPDRPEAE